MESREELQPDVDVYLFSQMGASVDGPRLVEFARSEFQNSPMGSWRAVGREVFLTSRILRLSFHTAGSLSKDSWTICEELRLIRVGLQDFEKRHLVELVILPTSVRSRPPRVAVFDMDSTLIQAEVIDELARHIGKMEEVASITDMAMNGKIDFKESLRLRVKLLRGLSVTVWDDLKARIEFMPGARDLTSALARNGVKLAVFSGGFQEMASWVSDELGLHWAVANKLLSSDPTEEFPYAHFTGELDTRAPIVDADRKRKLLETFTRENRVTLSQAICVGDGANDLQMLQACGADGGIAVAFKAKPMVQQSAPNRLNSRDLTDIFYLTNLLIEE